MTPFCNLLPGIYGTTLVVLN